jgi:DNA polymerase-3 subunit epsilon
MVGARKTAALGTGAGGHAEATHRLAPRRVLALALGGSAVLAFAVFGVVLALGTGGGQPDQQMSARTLAMVVSAAILAIAAAAGAAGWVIHRWLLRPLAALSDHVQFIADVNSARQIDREGYATLGALPDTVNALVRALQAARGEVDRSVAAATLRIEEQKARLEAILRDLGEGVVICNLHHQVLLYNQAALSALHVATEVGLGRSLFSLVTREPVIHTLERLTDQPSGRPSEATQTFICATSDGGSLLRARMGLIVDSGQEPTGYVLTVADVTREIAGLGRRDALLRGATEALRGPLANLRAAAETIAGHPEMPAGQRRAFDDVVLHESDVLSDRLHALDRDYRKLGHDHWPMADVHSFDLLKAVIRRLAVAGGPSVTMVGLPLWLHGDSHALVLLLERLLADLAAETGQSTFDIEALLGDKRTYIEISWEGAPVPSARLDARLDATLQGALGAPSLRDVLSRHGSEIWSRSQRPGRAMLRLPLPGPLRLPVDRDRDRPVPPRPEFYDFDLLHLPPPGEAIGGRSLRSLTYVVFDTEATGLAPSQGDEMVAIAAVRVVSGRVLTGETFSRLVNPRRPIPAASTRIHGITDDMVADAPPAEIVLPQFKAFVADSILVAHNAAFDLTLLHRHRAGPGLQLDNLALDTLLISAFLHPDMAEHGLDAIAGRLGIDIANRHSALGDAMAAAAVFVRLLDVLEARGIATLDELVRASNMTLEIRARKANF